MVASPLPISARASPTPPSQKLPVNPSILRIFTHWGMTLSPLSSTTASTLPSRSGMSSVRYAWFWLHAAGRAEWVAPSIVRRAAVRGTGWACAHPATPATTLTATATNRVRTDSPASLLFRHQPGEGFDDAASHELRAKALE